MCVDVLLQLTWQERLLRQLVLLMDLVGDICCSLTPDAILVITHQNRQYCLLVTFALPAKQNLTQFPSLHGMHVLDQLSI